MPFACVVEDVNMQFIPESVGDRLLSYRHKP